MPPNPPVEPPPSPWQLPDPRRPLLDDADSISELVGIGADLEPGTLLAAYRSGLFPMPLPPDLQAIADDATPIGWWSPDPRGVLPLDGLIVSRSLRKSCKRFRITVDEAFDDVMANCADPSRPHGWINDDITRAYRTLFDLGWAHSVEAWDASNGSLAGGLYGVAIGGLFAGESMFHRVTDASKVALVALVEILRYRKYELLDVQWRTDHLASLGVIDVPRDDYLDLVSLAVQVPGDALGPLEETFSF